MCTPINHFDRIPNETLIKVLGYLNYDELLIAKNVCKRFRGAIAYIINRSTVWIRDESKYLAVNSRKEEDFSPFARLFYDFKRNKADQCLISRQWKRFRYVSDYHPYIEKLIVCSPFLISMLNSFTNLCYLEVFTESWLSKDYHFSFNKRQYLEHHIEHLEILDDFILNRSFRNHDFKRDDSNTIFLNLEKLQTLIFITDFQMKKLSIVVSCPKLKQLTTDVNLDYFKVRFSNSIEEITCEENTLSLTQFRNLKKLTCYYFNYNYSGLLNNLKNLKEFYFYKYDENFLHLNYDHIKVYYKNIEFLPNQTWQNSVRKLSISQLNDCSLDFYSKNLKFLSETTPLIHRELRLQGGRNNFSSIQNELIEKLSNLKIFHINYETVDKSKYIAVFKVCDLDRLIIRSPFAMIDQDFLDLIPKLNSMLTFLKVDDFENLRFLLQLKCLKTFKTEQFFDFDLVKKMFDYLHHLKTIEILITVDIYKFKLTHDQVVCSYNHEVYLEEKKEIFVNSEYRNCIYKLYQVFLHNYK